MFFGFFLNYLNFHLLKNALNFNFKFNFSIENLFLYKNVQFFKTKAITSQIFISNTYEL